MNAFASRSLSSKASLNPLGSLYCSSSSPRQIESVSSFSPFKHSYTQVAVCLREQPHNCLMCITAAAADGYSTLSLH